MTLFKVKYLNLSTKLKRYTIRVEFLNPIQNQMFHKIFIYFLIYLFCKKLLILMSIKSFLRMNFINKNLKKVNDFFYFCLLFFAGI